MHETYEAIKYSETYNECNIERLAKVSLMVQTITWLTEQNQCEHDTIQAKNFFEIQHCV